MTRVIFRVGKRGDFKGDVTAVFPDIIADGQYNMMCYAHVGQHGSCSRDWFYQDTRPATSDEYAELMDELINIGYDDLKIYRKIEHRQRSQFAKKEAK